MTTPSVAKPRPLSPHLGIYKPQISSVMSILHRATGIGLALGLPVFVLWITMLAGGENTYAFFTDNLHNLLGQTAIFCVLVAIIWFCLSYIVCAARKNQSSSKLLKFILGLMVFIVAIVFACLARNYAFDKFPDIFDKSSEYIGVAMLVGWTWAFFYHFWNGLRHLLWDAGLFLTLRGMHITGWITITLSILSAAVIWLKIWGIMPS